MDRKRIAALSSLPFLMLFAIGASAQGSAQFSGPWVLDVQQSDNVGAKINATISPMNVLVRQLARPRLRATNVPYPQLIFDVGDNVHVDMPGYPSVSSPADGRPAFWHRKTGRSCAQMHGDCVEVTTVWEAGRLLQTFRAQDGQRQNIFTLSPDATTLSMAVTMTSPRLPGPLAYRLVYTRAE
jgi:hypothetical protein